MPDLTNAVLVPIDMQLGFEEASWPRRWNRDVDQRGLTLLAGWRAADKPIIHVRHDSATPGSALAPTHWGNAFRPGFGPKGDEALVTKSVNSAFIGTDLDIRLRRLSATCVVVFGITTDMCVSTSIRVGANLGWPMVMIPDACDCFDLPDGNGGVIPAEEIHTAHVATLRHEFCATFSRDEMLQLLKQG